MNKILHVFYDVHMGAAHAGLEALLKAKRKAPLLKHETALFVNKAWTGVKVLTANGSLLYWRSPSGHPISMEELRYLPAAFGGDKLTFTGSLESQTITAAQKRGILNKRLKEALTA